MSSTVLASPQVILDLVNEQAFTKLFTEELAWNRPEHPPITVTLDDNPITVRQVANYRGLGVWHCPHIPSREGQRLVDKEVALRNTERLIIFTEPGRQEWRWPRYTNHRGIGNPRLVNHPHIIGEPNPNLVERLTRITIDPTADTTLPELLQRMRDAFDAEAERASVAAARLMGALYEQLAAAGVNGADASVILARILFLMFGDDTNMWKDGASPIPNVFHDYLTDHTDPNGSDLAERLQSVFTTVDTPVTNRPSDINPHLNQLPYINGGIFHDPVTLPTALPPTLRSALIDACKFDWGQISPAVFGSMFQEVKSPEERRSLGEHYTTEQNILRTIDPLFMDELRKRLQAAWDSKGQLTRLHNSLKDLRFLDPACGCGNFLVVAYRELRALELELLKRRIELNELDGRHSGSVPQQPTLDATIGLNVSIDQFYGIEIEPWPARIAETAMFLIDHQANIRMEQDLGQAPDRLPISRSSHIHVGNALRLDWESVLPSTSAPFILGNPPFLGSRLRNKEQRADMALVWGETPKAGTLDYVTCWFRKAADYAAGQQPIRIGFVATNSISQGEQAAIMWDCLLKAGYHIDFAHRSFRWDNEARGQAAVHVVIVGFSQSAQGGLKRLWEYTKEGGPGRENAVSRINAYLADGPETLVKARSRPIIPTAPTLNPGSIPRDGGVLSKISDDTATEIRRTDPIAAKYLRRIYGAHEHLQGTRRWCLWLVDAPPIDLRSSPTLRARIRDVREERRGKPGPKGAASATPALFAQRHQPSTDYWLVPSVSSQIRPYIPISLYGPDEILTNAAFSLVSQSPAYFGILSSRAFTVWVRAVSSRMKSDFQISAGLVYNNFPFPQLTEKQLADLEKSAEHVLDTRKLFPNSTLAELYDSATMPVELAAAHQMLDGVVLDAYGLGLADSDAAVLAALFARFDELSN